MTSSTTNENDEPSSQAITNDRQISSLTNQHSSLQTVNEELQKSTKYYVKTGRPKPTVYRINATVT